MRLGPPASPSERSAGGRGLTLDGVDLETLASDIEGASPAWIKELLRRAAVIALASGSLSAVTSEHLKHAREQLASTGELGHRILGFGGDEPPDAPDPWRGHRGPGRPFDR